MKTDRSLQIVLGVIAFLVVAALILFFVRQGKTAYAGEDTPTGVVHNYILSVQKGDYQRSYKYLADQEGKPEIALFKSAFNNQQMMITTTGVELKEETITGDEAVVNLIILRSQGGAFSQPFRDFQVARLARAAGTGVWKIVEMPYPFWSWPSPGYPEKAIPVKPPEPVRVTPEPATPTPTN
jgi:hypothetical protein